MKYLKFQVTIIFLLCISNIFSQENENQKKCFFNVDYYFYGEKIMRNNGYELLMYSNDRKHYRVTTTSRCFDAEIDSANHKKASFSYTFINTNDSITDIKREVITFKRKDVKTIFKLIDSLKLDSIYWTDKTHLEFSDSTVYFSNVYEYSTPSLYYYMPVPECNKTNIPCSNFIQNLNSFDSWFYFNLRNYYNKEEKLMRKMKEKGYVHI